MTAHVTPIRRAGGPTSAPAGEILTPEEVSAKLRVPEGTLRYWRHTGEGPRSFKMGRSVRYYAADVDAYLAEQYTATDRNSR